jgi:hypothetical protein
MGKTPDGRRLEILQGTLDMLILRTLQWGPKYCQLTAGKAELLREQDRWSRLVHAIGRIMNPVPADSGK